MGMRLTFFWRILFCALALCPISAFRGLRSQPARFSMDRSGAAAEDPRTAGADALLGVESCLENMRWPDFLDWRVCRAAVRPKNRMNPFHGWGLRVRTPPASRVFSLSSSKRQVVRRQVKFCRVSARLVRRHSFRWLAWKCADRMNIALVRSKRPRRPLVHGCLPFSLAKWSRRGVLPIDE